MSPLGGSKLQQDVLWNLASLAVLGVSGIALNALIGRYYDAASLGSFNQVLAIYTFFSMAAAGGINLSALRAVAAHDRARAPEIVAGAIFPALALSALVTAVFWMARGSMAQLLGSDAVRLGVEAATPGLFFFALNKLLLGVVNGLQRMRAFAVYQALRYGLLVAGLLLAIPLEVPGARLPFVFSLAEGVLFVVLAVEVSLQIAWWKGKSWTPWARTHLDYGVKAVLSGMLLEMNAKVDILMLGLFLGDFEVGVYSFAALFAEGFYQLMVVLQNVYNPILARHIERREFDVLEAVVRKGRPATYAGMAAVGAILVILYPLGVELLTDNADFIAGRAPFAILVAGIVVAAGYLPFQNTLSMAGLPGRHTLFMLLVVLSNVIGNSILIPRWGMEGAAAATALAFFLSVFLLCWMVRRLVGFRL